MRNGKQLNYFVCAIKKFRNEEIGKISILKFVMKIFIFEIFGHTTRGN
jgi:hypothetical protein